MIPPEPSPVSPGSPPASGTVPANGDDDRLLSRVSRFFNKRRAAPNDFGGLSHGPLAGAETAKRREEILRAARLDVLKVYDIMVPRADIVAVEVATPLDDVVKLFAAATVSRMPIYRDSLDDPIGMVHVKDLVAELATDHGALDEIESRARSKERVLPRLRRDVLFVPPSMRLSSLLLKMQTSRIHMALVIDEYGGTDGLLSIEDLVEQIVGDIEDEHDEAEPADAIARAGDVWEVDARLPIGALETRLGAMLTPPDWEGEIDTLGGVVFALLGRVPIRGEIVHHPMGLEIEVTDADPRRVKRLKIKRNEPKTVPESEPGSPNTVGKAMLPP